jgi:uroporphyrinogen decarboxylase
VTPAVLTPMQRVLTTLGHQEPDRVPFFLGLTIHGARALGLSIREYFSRPEYVIEGQLRMRARYDHDLHMGLFYAAIELEAFGGETLFFDDGPPNAGAPVIRRSSQISALSAPIIQDHPPLMRVLAMLEGLKREVGDAVPIVGVAVSPFSLPVMQLGFEAYLDLLTGDRETFWRLMAVNEEFCVRWANAQLRAGATAICYFDPLASPTMIERPLYLETGHIVAKRTLSRIEGPTITHLASGRALAVLDDLAATGTAAVGVSVLEDLAELKRGCRNRMTVLGNLNAIEMRHWTPAEAERHVRDAISKGAAGGGFILSDNHGEIPWQVPESVLDEISAAVHRWGTYPVPEGR